MAAGKIYSELYALKKLKKSGFAVLIDPDKITLNNVPQIAKLCNNAAVDYVMVGGSLMITNQMEQCIKLFKAESNIPVIIFPGNPSQISKFADAVLYLSLLSGRNPELLIGQHVISAPIVKASGIEVISTGYILIDGGVSTSVSYISNSLPIPPSKPEIALCTAWAGEMQGKHVIYLEAGSGAINAINNELITLISTQIEIPLITGGGIRTANKVYENCKAGANLIVVGNAIESNSSLIKEMASAVKEANKT